MQNLTQLRLVAREIFEEALRAVDPGDAVRHAIHLEGSCVKICDTTLDLGDRKVHSIAIGKASFPMALALEDKLGERFSAGFMAGPILSSQPGRTLAETPRRPTTRWQLIEGGHPLPNENSLLAAEEAFNLLDLANQDRALVIFLVSGGGSAMIETPIRDDITLDDLRAANLALVNCGASISEVNTVRRALSATKSGRLAARASHCDQITLIVSDVPRGEEANVASGPSLAPASDVVNAREVVAQYNLRSLLPDAIVRAIDAEPKVMPRTESTSLRKHFVLLDNLSALEAAAKAAHRGGFATEIARDIVDQPIEEGCILLLKRLSRLANHAATLSAGRETLTFLVSGGEFACPVTGDGIGGRNLETALRLAIEYDRNKSDEPRTLVALCAGTDGVDGNSPAAGAIIDNTTLERARAIGLDPQDSLNRSDAYSFFVALGDVVATGPTGTNVRDLRILLATT